MRPARALLAVAAGLLILAFTAAPVRAQSHDAGDPGQPPPASDDAGTLARFLAGGALGFGLHEAGHVAAAGAAGTGVGLKGVSFGPVPFFAITHDDVSPRRDIDAMAAATVGILSDERRWREMSERGARDARARFARDRIVPQYEAVYEDAVASRRGRSVAGGVGA